MSGNSPKVFVTGVTGFVGGDALSVIVATHPNWHYTFLVRSEPRVASLIADHPSTSIQTVIGDLADLPVLTEEAQSADIVLHFASSDDVPSIKAIVSGLGSSSTSTHPKFLIHTSGTGNLLHDDFAKGNFGNAGGKVWDDIADIEAINAWPDTVFHHPVERVVLEAQNTYPHLRTAIICPPCIVGRTRGPGNKRTMQPPIMIEQIRQRGRAVKYGAGKAAWSFIHVHDLSDVFLRITEAAAAGGGSAVWGREGWYFVENGTREWGTVSERVAQRLFEKGELPSAEVDSLSEEDTKKAGFPAVALSANSKSRATRTRQVLGWEPKLGDFELYFDEIVDDEIERTKVKTV